MAHNQIKANNFNSIDYQTVRAIQYHISQSKCHKAYNIVTFHTFHCCKIADKKR